MSIFSGSSKIGKIYMGETSIGKVYKGSELVWQKGNGIQYYGYDGCLLLATNDTSGFLVSSISLPIKTISGTLGNSGSKVVVTTFATDYFPAQDYTMNYAITKNIGGKKVFVYISDSQNSLLGLFSWWIYVLEGSKVGSKVAQQISNTASQYLEWHPRSVSSSELVRTADPGATNTVSNARNTSLDGYWNA